MGSRITAFSRDEYNRLKDQLFFHMRAERLGQQAHSRREEAFAVYLESEAIDLDQQEHRKMFSELMELLGHSVGV